MDDIGDGDVVGPTGCGSVDVIVVTGGTGLRPPGTSSLEPIGIPVRPTAAVAPIPAGEDPDAAGFDPTLMPAVEHVPDAVPAIPPPSKPAVLPDVPGVIVDMVGAVHPELLPVIVPGTKLPGTG